MQILDFGVAPRASQIRVKLTNQVSNFELAIQLNKVKRVC